MAAITFANLKLRTARQLGNLPSSHPLYSNDLGAFVNEASNRVVLMATAKDRRGANIFPELRNFSTSAITVNATDEVTIPATILVLESLNITKSSAAYSAATQTEYPIFEESDSQLFGQFSKTQVGYPQRWMRSGATVKLWPTPTTAYLTRVVFRGIRREADLSADGDVLTMDYIWHPAVIDYACYLGANALGWDEDAKKWLSACEKKVTECLNLVGLERTKNNSRIEIGGTPR